MRWLQEKHKLLILAILIALLLWFYVNNQNDNFNVYFNNIQETFLLDLEAKNLPADYEIKNISDDKIVIKLEGIPLFHNYGKEDFSAYIDLSTINEGENISIVKVKAPADVEIKEIDPEFVKIIINKK